MYTDFGQGIYYVRGQSKKAGGRVAQMISTLGSGSDCQGSSPVMFLRQYLTLNVYLNPSVWISIGE